MPPPMNTLVAAGTLARRGDNGRGPIADVVVVYAANDRAKGARGGITGPAPIFAQLRAV